MLQFPSVTFTYQVYVVPGCNPVTEQVLLPLVLSSSLFVPMSGLVSMVQLNVSPSGSCMVAFSVVVVCMQSPLLLFVGPGLFVVGQLFVMVVKEYVVLVQFPQVSVMLADHQYFVL